MSEKKRIKMKKIINFSKKISLTILIFLSFFIKNDILLAENLKNNNQVKFENFSKEEKIFFIKEKIKIIVNILTLKIKELEDEKKKSIKENAQKLEKNKKNIESKFSYPYYEKNLKHKNYKPILGDHWQKGSAKWAYDVPLLEGSKIIASEDGIVKFIKEDSVKYGCSSKYNGKANYIVLSHEKEKKETLYLHLKKNSMKKYKIKVGQKVKKGQVIGEVGKSGFICGVHLHFQVQKKCNFWWCDSLKVQINK